MRLLASTKRLQDYSYTCSACYRAACAQPRRRFQHTEANREVRSDGAGLGEGSSRSSYGAGPQSSAAAHLLARARVEEADISPSAGLSARVLESQRKEIPWQGDESIEDAVLRMLVDKYKPLRVPGFTRKIQQPSTEPLIISTEPAAPRIMTAEGRIDQSTPGYRWQEGDPPRHPWEHTFRSPADKDGKPLVKTGNIMSSGSTFRPGGAATTHNKGARASAGDMAARVFRAKDASFDYASGSIDTAKAKAALGLKGKANDPRTKAQASGGTYTPMPQSIRAWNNMVDERIELARQQGLFRNIKGRGRPIERDPDESNPFLARSEFLMNRIVKRQEAAPPFVELQKEMRDELNGFRARLREAWIRRATRILSLQPLTPSVIESALDFRDTEWEQRERAYHESAVGAINSLIRRYNVVAPQSVRMWIVSVESELELCFRDCNTLIKEELSRRASAHGGSSSALGKVKQGREEGRKGKVLEEEAAVKETMLSAFRRLVREIVSNR